MEARENDVWLHLHCYPTPADNIVLPGYEFPNSYSGYIIKLLKLFYRIMWSYAIPETCLPCINSSMNYIKKCNAWTLSDFLSKHRSKLIASYTWLLNIWKGTGIAVTFRAFRSAIVKKDDGCTGILIISPNKKHSLSTTPCLYNCLANFQMIWVSKWTPKEIGPASCTVWDHKIANWFSDPSERQQTESYKTARPFWVPQRKTGLQKCLCNCLEP